MARRLVTGTLLQWRPEAGAMPVGYYAELCRSFSMDDVRGFAQLSGDDNPIHVDAAYAATTRFKRPIVHGMLYGSMFGTIFGSCISGSVYCNQNFTFKKPVYIDERVTARIEVTAVRTSPHHMATCRTTILKADGVVACEGEATVMLPPPLK